MPKGIHCLSIEGHLSDLSYQESHIKEEASYSSTNVAPAFAVQRSKNIKTKSVTYIYSVNSTKRWISSTS